MADDVVLTLLKAKLPARHATAAVKHFRDAVLEYQKRKWDDATAKTGKFVEAVLKVLAELLRYAQKGGDLAQTAALVAGLMRRRYPFIEEVDGRVYFHVPNVSARGVALLTLWHRYPGRVARAELIAAVKRHPGFTTNNANVAVSRLRGVVDDDG